MKSSSLMSGRFALSGVAAAALCLFMPSAWALGLGPLVVKSTLGEGLRAEIDVSSLTPDEASNLSIKIATPEAYSAAGVDYNNILSGTKVDLQRRSDGRPYLRLSSDRAVQEPFVDVILELKWNTGRLVREYTLLFDPPVTRAQAPATQPVTAPVASVAPPPATAAQPRPVAKAPPAMPEPRPPAAAPRAPETTTAMPKSAPAAPTPAPAAVAEPRKLAAAPATSDSYRVKRGDTLSGIASQTQSEGVSLDQMLVALYRANPQAFVSENMNRLKAGAVLNVPQSDSAKAIPDSEARQVIQAQSADFNAYRQRLAGAAVAAPESGTRQASGKVQAAVEDRKQSAAAAPDKLTLSKGSAKASAPEDRLSKEREAKDAATRAAELKKNVDDLQRLAAAAAAKPAVAPTAAAPAVASAPAPATAIVAKAPEAAPMPASAPAPEAAAASMAVATVAAPASAAPAPAPAPAAKPAAAPVAPMADEPSLIGSMLDDPLALGGAGLVVALLAGFGVYRYVKRKGKDSGETSFLESRLQPDSFFGVSGGQRIDTREGAATGAPSSMSYSLSQLDAIGDVDPVAEADVYLAYGRDLQAEEILKEALRAQPERMAIRGKLLEVYAKRRDTKGFELLATQLFTLTAGQGEDWESAQELGAQIDPDNPLYLPGGQPAHGGDDLPHEPLGASTMPQSILPSPSQFNAMVATSAAAAAPAANEELDLDLDLDLDLGAPPPLPEKTQPMHQTPAPAAADDMMSFDLPLDAPSAPEFAAESPPQDLSLAFDLSDISLDLDAPASPPPAAAPAPEVAEPAPFGADSRVSELPELEDDGVDPFERKLELAEEFRQIGDMDGARELLQEVIARADGATQAKARGMLNSLT
ncbi:MAG: FimV/HubP family polar landmark protein [Burkholderiales bacterium]